MNNDQFVRYKALDRCLRSEYGHFDMEQLVEECSKAVCSYHGDPDMSVSRSSVEHDLTDLKLRYDIKLCGNLRDGRKKIYRYEDTSFSLMKVLLADGTLEQMMLQNVLDTLTLYDDIPQYKWLKIFVQQQIAGKNKESGKSIEFQNNPDLSGMEWFDELLDAILQQRTIVLKYQKYGSDPKSYIISPYLLKQFNNRWFLIAKNIGYDALSNYPLDRIVGIEPADSNYESSTVDFGSYFDDVVGVSRDANKPVVDVYLRFSAIRYPYVATKPIHWSQTPVRSMWDENTRVVRLHVQINNELEASILSYGNDVEVLSPEDFRVKISQKIASSYGKYFNSANDLRNNELYLPCENKDFDNGKK